MTFTYSRTIESRYDPIRDKYYENSYDFDYEPEDQELVYAIADIWVGQQTGINGGVSKEQIEMVQRFINDHDLRDELAEKYKSELKDWFEDEALDSERGD